MAAVSEQDLHASRPVGQGYLILLPLLLLLLSAFFLFGETTDDPFITFRYAQNLLNGLGPVFNPGERVEGFTSPLHLLISCLLMKLLPGIGILLKMKLFSLLCAALLLLKMEPIGRRCSLTEREILLAQCLVAININFAIASVNALETTAYALLLILALDRFMTELQGDAGVKGGWKGCISALILVLALLTRPETMLIFAGLLLVRLLTLRQQGRPFSDAILWGAIFLVPLALLTLWRLTYFGQPLANTYYAKGISLKEGLPWAVKYLLQPLTPERIVLSGRKLPLALLMMALGAAYWLLAGIGWRRLAPGAVRNSLAAVVVLTILFVLKAGGDWMLGWRFLIGILPLLTMLQVRALRAFAGHENDRLQKMSLRWPHAAMVAVVLLLAVVSPRNSWSRSGVALTDRELISAAGLGSATGLGNLWVGMSDYIQHEFPRGSVIAYSEMGYASFANPDIKFLDICGLTDREIAHLPVHKNQTGVRDYQIYDDADPLNQFLKTKKPDALICLVDPGAKQTVMSNYYLSRILPFGAQNLYVFRRGSDVFRHGSGKSKQL